MVVVVNGKIFGGDVFSMKGSAIARMIGSKRVNPYEIFIARPKEVEKCSDGVMRNGVSAPFMPKSFKHEYHPGGNSLCYTIQTAHLMGCDPIYAMGFTLKSGSRYFWGDTKNPILNRGSIYDVRRALDWLSWYQSTWPGRVQLVQGWTGPVYDVFQMVTCDALRERFERPGSGASERNAESDGRDVPEEQRLRPDDDGPVAWLL